MLVCTVVEKIRKIGNTFLRNEEVWRENREELGFCVEMLTGNIRWLLCLGRATDETILLLLKHRKA